MLTLFALIIPTLDELLHIAAVLGILACIAWIFLPPPPSFVKAAQGLVGVAIIVVIGKLFGIL